MPHSSKNAKQNPALQRNSSDNGMGAPDVDFSLPSIQPRPMQLRAGSADADNPIQARFTHAGAPSFDAEMAATAWYHLDMKSQSEDLQKDFVSKFLDGSSHSLEAWITAKGLSPIDLTKTISNTARKSPLAQMRKVQLLLQGANVHNSTPASGRVIGPQEPSRKRKRSSDSTYTDDQRLDQSIRQLTTPILDLQERTGSQKGVESQMAFDHARSIGFIGFNNPTANAELFSNLTQGPSFLSSFGTMTNGISNIESQKDKSGNPRRLKNGHKRYKKSDQSDTVRRRTSKFRQRTEMSSEKRSEEFGPKTDGFFSFIEGLDAAKIHQYNPGDDPTGYQDGHLYVLDQNMKVPNTDTDEHVEVNHMEALEAMGTTKDQACIAGPKCPCATCTTKGRDKDLLTYQDLPGKIFDGQIPQTPGGFYDPAFLQRMHGHTNGGHKASAGFQYAQSDSDYSSEEESEHEASDHED